MVPSPDSGVESPDDRSAATFSRHVSRVTDRFDALLPFAAVPFGLSIVDVEAFRRALEPTPGSFSINVEFAFPAAFAVGYLFYAVPFLFVVDDARFLEAFRRSYGLALEGGPYVRFAVGHVLAAAVTSFLLSIAVSVGGAGVLVALVVATPLALILTAATVSFLRELAAADGLETVGGV